MGSPAGQEQGAPGAAELMDDQSAAEHRENEERRQYQENKAIFLAAALFPAQGWGVPFAATQTHSSNQQINKRGKYQMAKEMCLCHQAGHSWQHKLLLKVTQLWRGCKEQSGICSLLVWCFPKE